MAKKKDGFLRDVRESAPAGEAPYWLEKKTRELPAWMRDRTLLPTKPPQKAESEQLTRASTE